MASICIHLTIHGRVQGVGYRAWMAGNAQRLGLGGWVRNRRDSTVEAVICGDEAAVNALMDDCWRGPFAAKVTEVAAAPWAGDAPTNFQKLPTV